MLIYECNCEYNEMMEFVKRFCIYIYQTVMNRVKYLKIKGDRRVICGIRVGGDGRVEGER